METKTDTETVQVPLEKFLEVMNDNHDLKLNAEDRNPYMRWVHFAHMIDSYRLFPRIFFGVYILLMGYSGFWFMGLEAPLMSQTGFISTVWGAGAAWFGLYVNTGWKHGKQ